MSAGIGIIAIREGRKSRQKNKWNDKETDKGRKVGTDQKGQTMTELEAIEARHSVRKYIDKPIPSELRSQLDDFIAEVNAQSGLNIRVQYDDQDGFDSRLAHYGAFENVKNYIVLAGKKFSDFDFRCGYYGEKVVLRAQQLGLNTCWTALTFNKKNVKRILKPDETLCMVIALGFGVNNGAARKSKSAKEVMHSSDNVPEWFKAGIEAALKAPTAVNQQKFEFALDSDKASARVKGIGTYTKVDLGIAVYHFETASGRKVHRP